MQVITYSFTKFETIMSHLQITTSHVEKQRLARQNTTVI